MNPHIQALLAPHLAAAIGGGRGDRSRDDTPPEIAEYLKIRAEQKRRRKVSARALVEFKILVASLPPGVPSDGVVKRMGLLTDRMIIRHLEIAENVLVAKRLKVEVWHHRVVSADD